MNKGAEHINQGKKEKAPINRAALPAYSERTQAKNDLTRAFSARRLFTESLNDTHRTQSSEKHHQASCES
jgi:hypothetical protein